MSSQVVTVIRKGNYVFTGGAPGAATKISYINTNSGLNSLTVQGAIDELDTRIDNVNTTINTVVSGNYVSKTMMGAINGVAPLDSNGLISSTYLPSYVDDVLDGRYVSATQFNDLSGVAYVGTSGKIYIDVDTSTTYRWTGTIYGKVGSNLSIGTVAGTAYDGAAGAALAVRITALESPTWTIAGSVTALTSGETMATAFGKIAKAVSELITHEATTASSSVLGHVKASTVTPSAPGTAAVGTDDGTYARGNHTHAAQTTITGNAGTATALATARTISTTGDATGSGSFDGSANLAIALTLASSGVTAGTYRSVTVDAKGRVTAGTNPTTLAGYGITDAFITSGIITLGGNSITPYTSTNPQTSITGNAGTATTLATARTISISGDATASGSFDGSTNLALAMTLANSGVTAGTYRSVMVDAKGRVTSGSNPTTLSGYGITDAVIASGVITLGANTITPYTSTNPQTTITGNAGTATKLATARAINGVSFDGSADITIIPTSSLAVAAAGTTQATATVTTMVDIIQVTSGTGGIMLPTAVANRTIRVINTLAVAITVYPYTSGYIDALAVNVGISILAGGIMEFTAVSTTLWKTSTVFITDWGKVINKSTTIAGYGITDANISGNVITLGANTMTPYTASNPQTTITGNAATATTLATSRTISTTGDATGSGTFNGSADLAIALTLANSGATAGTYRSVTIDAKGRVTAGTNPTTLSGYGITDANISGNVITLGANTMTPYTASNPQTTISGLAGSATILATSRTISTTGDATGSGTFNGSADLAIALTLASSGVTAGTYRSVTVDAKGRVTAGTNPTTLAGYGITDAAIASGVITLGANSITPYTASNPQTNITGNAATATKLATAVTINGVSFDGSSNITISAGGSTSATNITGGGAGYLPYQSATDTTAFLAAGTAGYLLSSNGTSAPSWLANNLASLAPTDQFKTSVVAASASDLSASLQTSTTLTGYNATVSLACTTTAGSTIITTTNTAGLKSGGTINTATLYLAANTVISSITSATSFTVTNISAITTTAITGTGSVATATFAAKTYPPFAVGASITISGATPTGYNGTFTVTACTTTSVSWSSTTSTTATVQGSIAFTIAAGTSITTNFTNNISALAVDGILLSLNDRVLIKNQSMVGGLGVTANRDNGIYYLSTVGTTSIPWVLTRTTDTNTMPKLAGATVVAQQGSTNAGIVYRNKNKSTDTLGTTAVPFYALIDNAATTGSGNVVYATSPTITTPTISGNLTLSGGSILTASSLAVAAAGTTQATATAITTSSLIQVTSGTGGVSLPTATSGRTITIINALAVAITVYPATSGYIDDLAINIGISLAAGGIIEFTAVSTTQWRTSTNFIGDWSKMLNKSTTIAGYGITDANISGNVITLGANTITPYTASNPQVNITGNAATATADASGNVITSNYANSLAASGSSIQLKAKDGTVLTTLPTPHATTLTAAQYNALVLAGTVDMNMMYTVTGVNDGTTGSPQVVTTAQYNALTAADKLNTLYYISDYNNGMSLAELAAAITAMQTTINTLQTSLALKGGWVSLATLSTSGVWTSVTCASAISLYKQVALVVHDSANSFSTYTLGVAQFVQTTTSIPLGGQPPQNAYFGLAAYVSDTAVKLYTSNTSVTYVEFYGIY